ncbi:ESX secretion-associated protein EspG [Nocardia nova]|uniref:ESX secretion-associated protein EspG n=1 Tax=Nocardia nova TaxID=37330 RepID=UPI00379AF084
MQLDDQVVDDPVAVEINVDAALLLKTLVGIDSYPPVLALLPNIYRIEDRDRVHEVVAAQLTDAGVLLDDGRVHPVVERWLQCLYRPDVELAARIVDTGLDGEPRGMLRMSLVRSGSDHVLAVRNDDHVVLQSVFQQDEDLDILAGAIVSALGSALAASFEPWQVSSAQVSAVATEFGESAEPAELRRAFAELGAPPRTAAILERALNEVFRRAEVLVLEHHDGEYPRPEVCLSVLDTVSGRLVVSPSVAMDGELWSTYQPGDDAAIRSGITALINLLPSRSWFETSRIS